MRSSPIKRSKFKEDSATNGSPSSSPSHRPAAAGLHVVAGSLSGGDSSSSENSPTWARRRRRKLFTKSRQAALLGIKLCFTVFFLSLLFSISRLSQHDDEASSPSRTMMSALSYPPFEQYSENAPICTDLSPDDITFTLVSQCSDDRLWMMKYHCERWKNHPISLAVYTNRTQQEIEQELVTLNCLDVTVSTLRAGAVEDYPVNELRNIAFGAVQTTHVVYVDMDFWESTNLYETLSSLAIRTHLAESHKHALVLPAFALKRQCKDWIECPDQNIPIMPTEKSTLLNLAYNRSLTAFDPTNIGGHGSTKYAEWIDQTADELVEIDCVLSNRYEPYLVVRYCHDLPPFQLAFSGYGKNKMTWVMHLRRLGYRLHQVAEAFLVHYPHLDSKARLEWNGGKNGRPVRRPTGKHVNWLRYKRGRNDQAFVDFKRWLERTIPDESVVGYCEDHQDDDASLWIDHGDPFQEEDHSGFEEEGDVEEQ